MTPLQAASQVVKVSSKHWRVYLHQSMLGLTEHQSGVKRLHELEYWVAARDAIHSAFVSGRTMSEAVTHAEQAMDRLQLGI